MFKKEIKIDKEKIFREEVQAFLSEKYSAYDINKFLD